MASLQEILADPNYVNANPATKKAIFDKYSAQDTNYSGANEATKAAIRQKFGVEGKAPVAESKPVLSPSGIRKPPCLPRAGVPIRFCGCRLCHGCVGVAAGWCQSVRGLVQKGHRTECRHLSSLVTGEKPEGIGDKIWPKAPGSEGSGAKLAGAFADPVRGSSRVALAKLRPTQKSAVRASSMERKPPLKTSSAARRPAWQLADCPMR